jgi:Cu/Ag efflux protein CusF
MKRTRKLFYVFGIGVASWFTTPVWAQPSSQTPTQEQEQQPGESQPQGQQGQQGQQGMMPKKSATATVEKVDMAKRHLTLKDERGKEFTIQVPETVKRLEEIHKGDRIRVDYFEPTAQSLKKLEPGAQPSGGETTMMERNAGKLPSGQMAHQVTTAAQVMNVDREKNQLTIKKPNGDTDTISVNNPALQTQLAKLKEGDRVELTYTEGAAATVMREGKGSSQEKSMQQEKSMPRQDSSGE